MLRPAATGVVPLNQLLPLERAAVPVVLTGRAYERKAPFSARRCVAHWSTLICHNIPTTHTKAGRLTTTDGFHHN